MGEAEEDCSAGCSALSLMCQEDSADLDGDLAGGELVLLCNNAEEEEEYMGHLLSKEISFCCSPTSSSPSSPVLSSDAGDEPSSMAAEDWFLCARRATVEWILETRACFGFGHRTAYLAVAYFDRFCLRRCIDRSSMPWAAQLLAVACVSLAAKMEEYHAPPLPELAADGFSCASVRRMELLVLSTLGWRMAGVTPFDFLPCLAARLHRRRRDNNGGGDGVALVVNAAKAAALVFSAAQAASVLDFRPSAVAAAAVLAATNGAMTSDALESRMSCLSPSFLLDKEDVYACYAWMQSENLPPPSKTAAKRPSSCSDDGSTMCGSVVDAAASTYGAASCVAAVQNKRMRLEPAGIGR